MGTDGVTGTQPGVWPSHVHSCLQPAVRLLRCVWPLLSVKVTGAGVAALWVTDLSLKPWLDLDPRL